MSQAVGAESGAVGHRAGFGTLYLDHARKIDDRYGAGLRVAVKIGVDRKRQSTHRRNGYRRREKPQLDPANRRVGTGFIFPQRSERKTVSQGQIPVQAVWIDIDSVRALDLGGEHAHRDHLLDREPFANRKAKERHLVLRLRSHVKQICLRFPLLSGGSPRPRPRPTEQQGGNRYDSHHWVSFTRGCSLTAQSPLFISAKNRLPLYGWGPQVMGELGTKPSGSYAM